MKNVDVSVVITFFGSYDHLKHCVVSVLQSKDIRFEVILIDDNSVNPHKKLIAQLTKDPRVTYTYLTKHAGISKSRNIGAALASGPYLLFLDVDRSLTPKTLLCLLRVMESHRSIGMLQALLLAEDTSVESSGHFFSFIGLPYNFIDASKKKEVLPIFGVRGAHMVRTTEFNRIGGYDEDFRLNGEDTDLSWRFWLSGSSVYVCPRAVTYHHKEDEEAVSTRMMQRVYYSGSKTVIAMLLKNTLLSTMVWMLPLCLAAWVAVSLKLLVSGKFRYALFIYQGMGWNVLHFLTTVQKRKKIQAHYHAIKPEIFYGPLSWRVLMRRGLSWGMFC